MAKDQIFDCIILDCELPGQLGDMIAELRSAASLSRLPLLALHDQGDQANTATANAISDVFGLARDCSPGELLVKLATQLRVRKLDNEQSDLNQKVALQNAQAARPYRTISK